MGAGVSARLSRAGRHWLLVSQYGARSNDKLRISLGAPWIVGNASLVWLTSWRNRLLAGHRRFAGGASGAVSTRGTAIEPVVDINDVRYPSAGGAGRCHSPGYSGAASPAVLSLGQEEGMIESAARSEER